jgi:hypothetical protein
MVRPPNYRGEEKVPWMILPKSCQNCIYQREFEGWIVCTKYLCRLHLWMMCDSWDGGSEKQMDANRRWILTFLHEHWPSEEEREVLQKVGPMGFAESS